MLSSTSLNLYTDACTTDGFGLVLGSHWTFGAWEDKFKSYNIAVLEFYPILLAVHLWAPLLANSVVVFHTDNIALVSVINNQTCRDPQLMHVLRQLVLVCLRHNILFRCEHIKGILNSQADILSRLNSKFQMEDFWNASSHLKMDPDPVEIPEDLHHRFLLPP